MGVSAGDFSYHCFFPSAPCTRKPSLEREIHSESPVYISSAWFVFLEPAFHPQGDSFSEIKMSADELTKEQVEMLKKAFDMFDKEKKGSINTSMVSTILRTLGQQFVESELKELIQEIDADGSGELEFDEFLALTARFLVEEDSEAMQEELREAFRMYDKEGNGYINVADLREILRALDDKLTEDELDEMIAEIDTDGSGTVDFDEFMEMMTGD